MTFLTPDLLWLLLLAPAAGLGAGLLWRRRLDAAAAWSASALWDRLLPGYDWRRLFALAFALALTAGATITALAGPLWGYVEEEVERRGIDLVFVIDSSLSMSAVDVDPSRLVAAKTVIRRLLRKLPGHRVGLVQSEGEGDVLAPLTLDRVVVDMLLTSVEPASLPTPGTLLQHGLDRALELLPEDSDGSGVIIVVSDGEDHGASWESALERAKKAGIVVHALGVGTEAGSPLPVPGGDPRRYKVDRQDQTVHSRLQPERLRELATATGGIYLQVGVAGADLHPLIEQVDAARERSFGTSTVRHHRPRFQWFLALAAAGLALMLGLSPFRPSLEVSG